MGTRLARCTALWGRADAFAGAPGLRRLDEAVYRPYAEAGAWGLFAPDGTRLTEHGRDGAGQDVGQGAGHGGDEGAGEEAGEAAGLPAIEGPFLYAGPLALHYGHFLTATLPRLWPLADWRGPRPAILCHLAGSPGAWAGLGFLEAILGRLGFGPGDIVVLDRARRLRDVAVPEPALREQAGMHAGFGAFCREIGQGFWDAAEIDRDPRPVYLSKTRLRAGIAHATNEAEIEAELVRRGVRIAWPETLGLPEQIRLLNRHRVVMGTVGSAFHTVAFAAPGRRLVGLNWQPLVNANFALLERANGARARHYFPLGTRYDEAADWGVSWTVPDPRGVARALLARARWLARGEPDAPGALAQARRLALRPVRALNPFRAR